MYSSTKVIQLSRKYQKFPSFIAELTSILQEILLLFVFFVNLYERKAIEHLLIPKMFKLKGTKNYNTLYLINKFSQTSMEFFVKEVNIYDANNKDKNSYNNEQEFRNRNKKNITIMKNPFFPSNTKSSNTINNIMNNSINNIKSNTNNIIFINSRSSCRVKTSFNQGSLHNILVLIMLQKEILLKIELIN